MYSEPKLSKTRIVLVSALCGLLSTSTLAIDLDRYYSDLGEREVDRWVEIVCRQASELYSTHLVEHSKALSEIIERTKPNSNERRNALGNYQLEIRKRIEHLRGMPPIKKATEDKDPMQGIWGYLHLAVYTNALTYSLEKPGEVFPLEARHILYSECRSRRR